jgi:chromosome partitioning protein
MDAKGAAKTIKLIRNQERMARRQIPHAVLLTRTSAAIASRALKNVRDQLDKAGIDVFMTSIVERAAYRDMFDYGGTLENLDPALVANLDKAKDNAREYVGEILKKLRAPAKAAKVA